MPIEGHIRVCAWCRRLLVGDGVGPRRYTPTELAIMRLRYTVSDGICSDCAAEEREKIAATQAALEYQRRYEAALDGIRG